MPYKISLTPKISIKTPKRRERRAEDICVEIYAPRREKGTPVRISGSAFFTAIRLFFRWMNIAQADAGIKQ